MRSQLLDVNITNISGNPWTAEYDYKVNGDMTCRTIQGSQTSFTYIGNLMDIASGGESFDLDWDENGNMKNLPYIMSTKLKYTWDGLLRYGGHGR